MGYSLWDHRVGHDLACTHTHVCACIGTHMWVHAHMYTQTCTGTRVQTHTDEAKLSTL